MSGRSSFQVFFQTHHDGRLTGTLMRAWSWFFDTPAPAAYGATEQDVLDQLAVHIQEREITGADYLERYVWEESFKISRVTVEVHPQTRVNKHPVIGSKSIPLRLTYAWSETPSGAFRVIVPRFDWRMVLEDLELAPEVLRNAVSTVLLGGKDRWLYDFRQEGPEYVYAWTPNLLRRLASRPYEDDTMEAGPPTISAVCEAWSSRAGQRRLPALVGGDEDLRPWKSLICRTPPANLLLVGPPGVGKTAWVQRLARALPVWQRQERDLTTPRIWATSADRILAGMVYLGQWQKRCLALIEELSDEGDYLYVDRLTDMLKPTPDGASIMEMFEPALREGAVSIIAECSPSEYERCQRRFTSLLGRFQIVRVEPPSLASVTRLLKLMLERSPCPWTFHPSGLKRAVRLLEMFQPSVAFPGKAARMAAWIGQTLAKDRPRIAYARETTALYARYSGLPVRLLDDSVIATPDDIAAELGARVIGQPQACAVCGRAIARFKAGLNDPERPCASLVFIGPTGVGKTELARTLTRTLFGDPARMIRLDMSEYMAPGSAQRLLAVDRRSGSLAEKVRQQPLSLVLLDEIEKAHPEVFDLLLGVLGEGRLTDALGRLVDFRMTLIVLTSNLGVRQRPAPGFESGQDDDGSARAQRALREHFRPEFVARLDHVIPFRALAPEDVARIVDLELDKVAQRDGFARRQLTLDVAPDARAKLANLGYDPARGARPLKRLIEARVVAPIAVEMARNPALARRTFRVSVDGDDRLDVRLV